MTGGAVSAPTRTRARETDIDEAIKAYRPGAIKAYLWLRAHARENGTVEYKLRELVAGMGYRPTYKMAAVRYARELAMGWPTAPPLIAWISSGPGNKLIVKILGKDGE
jgi:hypothetical protein